jgi:2-polyprenyl-3-methyl-5-hydroxy-6-metoxy-1,4-benzoquinol methylase
MTAMESSPTFAELQSSYDTLASEYHEIFHDWETTIREHGLALNKLTRRLLASADDETVRDEPLRILDLACGIGTQAFGLTLHGNSVTARDLSPLAIDGAREHARRMGFAPDNPSLAVADMRDCDPACRGEYDAVLALANALPHLNSPVDIRRTFSNMFEALRPGGVALVSTVDYDALLDHPVALRPRFEPTPRIVEPRGLEGPRRIVLQVWDWDEDESHGEFYDLNIILLRTSDDGTWRTTSHTVRYYPIRRDTVEAAAREVGFIATRWYTPVETGFYEQIFTARRPG